MTPDVDSPANDPTSPWTAEEDALARDWYAAGRSPAFIGRELGRTPAAVRMHLSRLGVRRPSIGPERSVRRRAPDDIATSDAMALSLARAIPAVIGADRAVVALVDHADGVVRVAADHGAADPDSEGHADG